MVGATATGGGVGFAGSLATTGGSAGVVAAISGAASAAVIEATESDAVEEAGRYLDGIAAGIREKGFAVQVAARFGNPSKAIIEFAQRNQIDLLVMCTRGQTGPARWLLGSVTDHVVRGSTIPVVVVPARAEGLQEADG